MRRKFALPVRASGPNFRADFERKLCIVPQVNRVVADQWLGKKATGVGP
jgi:hypothetical protein